MMLCYCLDEAKQIEEIKECLTTVKQVFFHYKGGSLVDHRASKPNTLVGPPALRLALDPLAVKLLNNRPCILLTSSKF